MKNIKTYKRKKLTFDESSYVKIIAECVIEHNLPVSNDIYGMKMYAIKITPLRSIKVPLIIIKLHDKNYDIEYNIQIYEDDRNVYIDSVMDEDLAPYKIPIMVFGNELELCKLLIEAMARARKYYRES